METAGNNGIDRKDERYALAEKALDDVRAILQGDGGDIFLRRISEDGRTVEVSLTGVCESCPVSEITLGGIVRSSLRRYLPQLEKVVNVPEYAQGEGED